MTRPENDPSGEPTESAVTRIITMLESAGPRRSEDLIPLVYDDLRRLARSRMASQPAGQTLQATALVHEAYLRIERSGCDDWESRGHFFAAAAESMRRIVIETIRRKKTRKRGGGFERAEIDVIELPDGIKDDQLLEVDEALEELEKVDAESAELVKLRFFAGLTLVDAAHVLEISERTARRRWNYARAWLFDHIHPRE